MTTQASLAVTYRKPSANYLLSDLPEADLTVLARHLQVVSFSTGALLQCQDGPAEYAYFPHEGMISLLATTPDGQTIEAAAVGRSGAVCPISKLETRGSLFSAVALGPMRVSRINVARLEVIRTECQQIDRALRVSQEELLRQIRQNLVCGALHPIERRLARWLLEAAERVDTDEDALPATQDQVAQRLGARRTTVTLMVGKLQQAGAIRWGRSRVHILDRARLHEKVCTCYAALRADRSRWLHQR